MLLKDLKFSEKALKEDRQRKGSLPCQPLNKDAPRVVIEIQNGRVYWVSAEVEIQVITVNHDKGLVARRPWFRASKSFLEELFALADELAGFNLDKDT